MAVIIREYQKGDFLNMATMSHDEWSSQVLLVARNLRDYDGKIEKCYIAETDDNMVGFIYGFTLPNRSLIPEFLYVKPECRKMGVGTKLLDCLEKNSNCDTSMIFYHKSLRGYYSKRGYEIGENLETAMKIIESSKEADQ